MEYAIVRDGGDLQMKTIIFDFDGTLADSKTVFCDAWNEFAPTFNYKKAGLSDIQATNHMTLNERARRFHFPMHKLPIILPKIYRYFYEHIDEIKLFDGMKEVIESLADNGYTIYILSSNKKENIERVLSLHNVTAVREVLSSSKLFGKDRVLKKLLKEEGLAPEQIVYIGDELRDLEACRKVNITFGWVSWGLDGEAMMDRLTPSYKFSTPQQITEQLI